MKNRRVKPYDWEEETRGHVGFRYGIAWTAIWLYTARYKPHSATDFTSPASQQDALVK
jgi:hypothetical protein